MTKVWDYGPSDRSERFVLLALADNANDAGVCWPSLDYLQDKCCFSRQGLCNVLDRLEEKGYIVRQRGGGKGNSTTYEIKLDNLQPLPKSQADKSQVGTGKSQVDTGKSQVGKDKESTGLDGNRHRTVIEPSLNQRESAREKKDDPSTDSFESFEDLRDRLLSIDEPAEVLTEAFRIANPHQRPPRPNVIQRVEMSAIVDNSERWVDVLIDLVRRGHTGKQAIGWAINNYKNTSDKSRGRNGERAEQGDDADEWEGFIQ